MHPRWLVSLASVIGYHVHKVRTRTNFCEPSRLLESVKVSRHSWRTGEMQSLQEVFKAAEQSLSPQWPLRDTRKPGAARQGQPRNMLRSTRGALAMSALPGTLFMMDVCDACLGDPEGDEELSATALLPAAAPRWFRNCPRSDSNNLTACTATKTWDLTTQSHMANFARISRTVLRGCGLQGPSRFGHTYYKGEPHVASHGITMTTTNSMKQTYVWASGKTGSPAGAMVARQSKYDRHDFVSYTNSLKASNL